jgi:hypothetical protein
MELEKSIVLEWENVIQKLASSYPADEQKAIMRDVVIVTQTKSVGVGQDKRKINVYEGFTYVIAANSLGLNPMLNHLIFLEDQLYITLAGHLHNAHASGTLRNLSTKMVGITEIDYIKRDWEAKKDVSFKGKQYRCECVITRKIGEDMAEFRAEWVADPSNVPSKGAVSELKLEQMAEARAMRRCLARAFPVGLSSFEDVQDERSVSTEPVKIAQPDGEEYSLAYEINNCQTLTELEAMKPKISKSKSGIAIQQYAQRKQEIEAEMEDARESDNKIREEVDTEEKAKLEEFKKEIGDEIPQEDETPDPNA